MSDVIHVSIGSEPKQEIAAAVLRSSILRRASRPVVFSASWLPESGWHPAIREVPRLQRGTLFNTWRWLVPRCYANRGRAIYLDADQVVLADIAELWDLLEPGKQFAAVTEARGIFGKKKPEPGAIQTSVMVMDCDACDWNPGTLIAQVAAGSLAYRDLMQGRFLERSRIQSIDPAWNHFGICEPETKLVHWSHVASQPYRKPEHPTAGVFRQELHAAIRAGHVRRGDVFKACANGGLCMTWGNNLPDDADPITPPAGFIPPGVPADARLGFPPQDPGRR
jgi:hypothetical protein